MDKQNKINFEEWLRVTVKNLNQALSKHGIKNSKLSKSIAGEIVKTGKDVDQVIIKFAQYGRFVDMGVGRGMPMGSRKKLGDDKFLKKRNEKGQLHHYKRIAKPWFSKTKTKEVARLRELLLEHQEGLVLNAFEGNFKN